MPNKKNPTGEDRLWWAVVRQAAQELRYGPRSGALDAGDFLYNSGGVLISYLFGITTGETNRELTRLIRDRNRYHEEPIDLPNPPKS